MTQYNMCDTKRPDGFYITFERLDTYDDQAHPNDYLFADAAYQAEDQARLDAWQNDEGHFIGIQARAHCVLVRNGVGTFYTLTSPGLWGIESDSGDYLAEVFQEQVDILKSDIAAMQDPSYR